MERTSYWKEGGSYHRSLLGRCHWCLLWICLTNDSGVPRCFLDIALLPFAHSFCCSKMLPRYCSAAVCSALAIHFAVQQSLLLATFQKIFISRGRGYMYNPVIRQVCHTINHYYHSRTRCLGNITHSLPQVLLLVLSNNTWQWTHDISWYCVLLWQ